METFESIDEISKGREPRPTFLTVLCVLSFIFIGFFLIIGLLGLAQGPISPEKMIDLKVEFTTSADEMRSLDMESFAVGMEKLSRMSESRNSNFYAYSIVSLVVLGIGLFGVFKMWKGFKIGFHLYIAYSLLTIVQDYFFVSPADIPTFFVIWNLLISALFVLMYSRNLKWLS